MMGTTIGSLPNIAGLKIDNTKNSDNSEFSKNSPIELVSLQGIHICDQNRHATLESKLLKIAIS